MALTPPVLDVAPGLFEPWQVESRTAEQRHCFRLTLPEVPRRDFAITLLTFGRMAEQHMR